MTQEEKAKAYDEALERAKAYHRNELAGSKKEMMEYIFPELRESEDERIRRTLVEYFGPKVQLDFVRGIPIQKIRDWLEKQKEQNEDVPLQPIIYTEQGEVLAEPKPAWSEEDENALQYLHELIGYGYVQKYMDAQTTHDMRKWVNEHLRPDTFQNGNSRPKTSDNWKPSEEQLNALNFAITYFMHETNYKNPTELCELYDDLLKLK